MLSTRTTIIDNYGQSQNIGNENKDSDNKLEMIINLYPDYQNLTGREKEVLELLVQGLTNKDIASTLDVSENTIKTHTKNIYGKISIRNKKELLKQVYDYRKNK